MAAFSEADMYRPVKLFFTGLGYKVMGEVLGCDIAMEKDGALTVIELKKSLNLKLLCQAVDRQGITPQVYIAIPRPKRARNRENSQILKILQKLELGLIYVSMDTPKKTVEIACFPPPVLGRAKKRRDRILQEMNGRSMDLNRGGQTGLPLATAYREKAVKIACFLDARGALAPKDLVGLGCDRYAASILRNNYYGWFEKTTGGCYGLSAEGVKMLLDETRGAFPELVGQYLSEANNL